jgi:hypothetical protein
MGTLVAGSACSDDTRSCTGDYSYGLGINVEDSAGGAVCDVTIKIQDGSYVEEKPLTESACFVMAAGERPGTYRVTASRDGTVLAEERVTVRDDACHPIGESLTLVID